METRSAVLYPNEFARVITAAGRYKGLNGKKELKGIID